MAEINLLDKETINQIAAGEVIDRPASIVKELLENAIDAGATMVTVDIKDGGISFIRITDNGKGIEKSDIPVAFLRHSTSKINNVKDLSNIRSLGFRGEALSSIAAISQVELITKREEDDLGSRYLINGSEEESLEEIGVPDGTTFIIRNVFFNTPARKKFLKSAQTESSYILDIVEKLSLSHPEISFKFINNGNTKLYSPGTGKLKDVIYGIFGRETVNNLLELNEKCENIKVTGYVGKPVINRGNRNFENYFINGRYIKNKIIAKAIEDAYKPYIMQHKYPFCVFHIDIDNEAIDVNVHPSKMELRFENQEEVYDFLYNAIANALEEKELIVDVSLDENVNDNEYVQEVVKKAPEPFERKRVVEFAAKVNDVLEHNNNLNNVSNNIIDNGIGDVINVSDNTLNNYGNTENANSNAGYSSGPICHDDLIKESEKTLENNGLKPKQETFFTDRFLSENAINKHKLIGQVFNTYWIVEYNDKLYIMDQHAAHEKVLYERLLRDLDEKKFTSQHLITPIMVSLTVNEEEIVKKHIEEFKTLGYEIESFGGNDYAISAVPANLYSLDEKDLFIEILDELEGSLNINRNISVLEKIASASCKAAVKGNMRLSTIEVNALIEDLLKLDNPYHCPHGRPTLISFSKYELEKKFKRVVD